MKADVNRSHQAHAHDNGHTGSAPPGLALGAGSTRYTCPMHPEIVRDAPGTCPKCGMTLIPILEAIPRAAALSCTTMRNINQAEPGFCIWLQRAGNPDRRGRPVPVLRRAVVAHLRRRGNGIELGFGGHKCVATAAREIVTKMHHYEAQMLDLHQDEHPATALNYRGLAVISGGRHLKRRST